MSCSLAGASRRTGAIADRKYCNLSVTIAPQPAQATHRLIRMTRHLRAAAALLVLVLAGCGSTQPPPTMARGVAVREPLADPRPFGAADTAFGLNVLDAWCQASPQSNLVLSPSSLASGLGMAYLGARAGTARAMAAVLRLPTASGGSLEAGLQARSAALRSLNGPGVTLKAADQVWADPSLKTRPSYLNAVATSYDAGVAQVPLLRSPDSAIGQIDAAIATATAGHIPQLLAPGSLQGIGWVLTDALYMNAAWASPFDAGETSPGPFTTADGQQASAQFMHGGDFSAATAAGWTAVSLPYRGGKLSMVALLPPSGAGGCAMPAGPALASMTSRLAAGGAAGVLTRSVALPKVSIATQVSMKPLLSKLGMGVAFSTSANFTGLSPQACCIGLVEHAATLQVGEKGTVASAATAVGITASAGRVESPPVVFDRPYLLLVTDQATGEPLFLARVANPAAE
jgi:serine protease inhibitor